MIKTSFALIILALFVNAPALADNNAGKRVYKQSCSVCHAKGVAGAPKLGDLPAWNKRIAKGQAVLYNSVVKGMGAMPARGGNPSLSDAEIKAAVDYLTSNSSQL